MQENDGLWQINKKCDSKFFARLYVDFKFSTDVFTFAYYSLKNKPIEKNKLRIVLITKYLQLCQTQNDL